MLTQVAFHQGGKGRRRGSKAHGTRREINGVGILGSAGIGLQAAIGAELGQVGCIEPTEEVLHGVIGRRGMRLDRHAIARPQIRKVKSGEDRHHRGAGSLVPADLGLFSVGPQRIGVVDHPRAQPEHAVLDIAQSLEVERTERPDGGVRQGGDIRQGRRRSCRAGSGDGGCVGGIQGHGQEPASTFPHSYRWNEFPPPRVIVSQIYRPAGNGRFLPQRSQRTRRNAREARSKR